jgi:hypothetical protein
MPSKVWQRVLSLYSASTHSFSSRRWRSVGRSGRRAADGAWSAAASRPQALAVGTTGGALTRGVQGPRGRVRRVDDSSQDAHLAVPPRQHPHRSDQHGCHDPCSAVGDFDRFPCYGEHHQTARERQAGVIPPPRPRGPRMVIAHNGETVRMNAYDGAEYHDGCGLEGPRSRNLGEADHAVTVPPATG